MDIKQDLNSEEEIDRLRLETKDLKKDLERERLLHNMLYKEWKELQEQLSAKEGEVIENRKAPTGFYKYAFYALLILMIPIAYFLYPPAGFVKNHVATNSIPDATLNNDTTLGASTSTLRDTAKTNAVSPGQTNKTNAVAPLDEKKKYDEVAVQKIVVESPPVKKPVEKKITLPDTSKKLPVAIVRKPVIEKPLTDDIRDSIASEGFSGYLYHLRNPYPKSSERYKIWVKGWNNGKEEAMKVVAKDPSLKGK